MYQARRASIAIAAIPPNTPPAIAPTGVDELSVGDAFVADAVAEEAVLEVTDAVDVFDEGVETIKISKRLSYTTPKRTLASLYRRQNRLASLELIPR